MLSVRYSPLRQRVRYLRVVHDRCDEAVLEAPGGYSDVQTLGDRVRALPRRLLTALDALFFSDPPLVETPDPPHPSLIALVRLMARHAAAADLAAQMSNPHMGDPA